MEKSIVDSNTAEIDKAGAVKVEGINVSGLALALYSVVLKMQTGRQVFKVLITR